MNKEQIIQAAEDFDVLCFFGFEPFEVFSFLENKQKKSYVFFKQEASFIRGRENIYEVALGDLAYFQQICLEKVFQSFFYIVSSNRKQELSSFMTQCQQVEWQVNLSGSDYQDFGVAVFRNMVQASYKSFDAGSFFLQKNSLQGVPAIICGAGPSLEESVELLKQVKNKAAIFAGGAALGFLTNKGVAIDIAAGIDPDPSYERTLMQESFEAPFFCQSRFSSLGLDCIQGRIFQVPSNPGYLIEEWMQDGESFDGGWTVSTFMSALAVHLGCSPIILVGVDLISSKEGLYAEGVVLQDILEGIPWVDPILGECRTKKDWVLSARWLEYLASRSSNTPFYNGSFQGLSLKGISQRSLEDFIKQLPFCDVQALVWTLSSLWKKSDSLSVKLAFLGKSIEDSLLIIEKILSLFARFYPGDPSEKGEFILCLYDLQEELFYQKVLEPLWQVWQFPMAREFIEPYAKEVNRFLFFKKVLIEYRGCLCKR